MQTYCSNFHKSVHLKMEFMIFKSLLGVILTVCILFILILQGFALIFPSVYWCCDIFHGKNIPVGLLIAMLTRVLKLLLCENLNIKI